jgi:uncharacterized protein (TIGR02594 family)
LAVDILRTVAHVKRVQARLKDLGFDPGPIDGIRGARTNAAIIAFKQSRGLLPRSLYGQITEETLFLSKAPAAFTDDPIKTTTLPWIVRFRKVIGLQEVRDNAELRSFLRSDGRTLGDPALNPWCGDLVETCILLGIPAEKPYMPETLRANPYWALNWRLFGIPCEPRFGAVVSVTRPGGGHVGFALGKDQFGRILVGGGNQSNRICVAPLDASRFEAKAWRWPRTFEHLAPEPLPSMTSTDVTSVNEQ